MLLASASWAAQASAWVDTATQGLSLKNAAGVAALPGATPMHIAVGLQIRNKAALDRFVAEANTPSSASFGQTLTPVQFLAAYAPTVDQAQAVMNYLAEAGFTNLALSGNRLLITADGTAAQVQGAFNTQMVQLPAAGKTAGKTVYANRTAAQVPASLAGTVAAVLGLQNIDTLHTQLELDRNAGKASRAAAPRPVPNIGLPSNPLTDPFFSASMFQTAYDAGSTPTGWGATIGIVTEGDIAQVPKDLRTYEQENKLPQVPYEIVYTGVKTTDTAGIDEWDLDSQSSSGIAGNLRKIIFYNAGSLADVDLTGAFERIASEARVKAVNISIGGCETLEYLSGAMLLDDLAFEAGAAEGITFFASSGDGGASCQLLINAGEPVLLGMVEYPASSTYVVAVGGTSLFISDTGGTYDFETAWVSGGGGNSLWEAPGAWQSKVVPLANSTTALRGVPDVAMDADNNLSPANVVVNGADTGVGGTSLSSPLTVGTWARLQTAHGVCYGFAAPIFYAYAGGLLTAAKDFHDIILGDNFLYPATPGWDYTTGLGSFDISAVNADLPAIACVPEPPVDLTAAVNTGTIVLNWTGSPGATSYDVYLGTSAGGEAAKAVRSATGTSLTLSGLKGGTTYFFKVSAVNAKGESAKSDEASVFLPLPPAAPTGLTGTPGNATAKLSWKAVAGAGSYDVYIGSAAGAESSIPIAAGVTATAATISGLNNGRTYYFVVTAVGAGGQSAKSNEASVALPAVPPAPFFLKATPGKGLVTLVWGASSGAAKYLVFEGSRSGGESPTPAATATGTTATIGGLIAGKTYYFQVAAANSAGTQSPKSQEASATAN